MPTTYAHWRFGDRCLKTLPQEYQDICNKYRNEFDFGVHGPDIFFYYNCLKHNDINSYGTWMHDQPFKLHLEMFKKNYQKHSNKEAALAYILGFLCHFTLDSYCHGYIDHKAEDQGPSHGRIEAQLDRYFLIKDGLDPIKTSVTFSLKPTKQCCHNIALMYDKYDETVITKTMKDQVLYLNLLKDSNDVKRAALVMAMKAAKVNDFIDLLIGKVEDPKCKDATLRCDKYFEKAKEHYPLLANSLIAYLIEDKDLDVYFNNHFCPKPDYKQIPLLSYEEELNYTVDFQK